MTYRSLRQCVDDLRSVDKLIVVEDPVDAHLEAAEIQRRVFAAGGPALLFANVRGCRFPMASNLFGTIQRARYLFRDALEGVQQLVALAADPSRASRRPWRYVQAGRTALAMRPKFVRGGAVLSRQTTIGQLPQQVSWPRDGGAFITLPQVYTENVSQPGWRRSNLGMYRVQLSGGRYLPDREIGLHYQIHRHIGVHHEAALRTGKPLQVAIFVGGPPAMTVAAVMPLPEGMSELSFAGALNRRRVRLVRQPQQLPIHADADFCITGTVDLDNKLPEGPFGDHLGYYSLVHDFPMLRVQHVYHREDAIWPFTVVGRPPQEDTVFGKLIHELTGPVISKVLPGVEAVHAVDEAGVHPLLLAIGSERYTPYSDPGRPQELLTQAHAILGQGQLSLAKYLLIANRNDDLQLDIGDVAAFLRHMLARADWTRDLHFQTQTTIDTLDYSGHALNAGSKLVVAAAGRPTFPLQSELPDRLRLPPGFDNPRLVLPGVLAIEGPPCDAQVDGRPRNVAADVAAFCDSYRASDVINQFRWVVIVDDSAFVADSLRNFIWVTFTRSNPAADIQGIDAFLADKHWGCRGALVIDARIKPHHAPPLVEDPEVTAKVDAMAARGGPLAKYL